MSPTLTARAATAAGSKTSMSAEFTVAPRAGMTVNVQANLYPGCPGGPVDLCSAATVDGLTGLRLAQAIQKVYLAPGQLPATVSPAWQAFVANGGQLLISFRPPPTFSAAHDAAFTACVAAINAALGASWKAVLWQEPNTSHSAANGITSAAVYVALVSHYGPLFRAAAPGISLVYNPALCGKGDSCNAASCAAFLPDPAFIDEFYVDFYGTAWYGTRGGRLEDVVGLADGLGVPFGLGEWGASASSSWTFNQAQWESYVSYLTAFFVARRAAGGRIGWLLYWGANDGGNVGSTDVVMSATDPKIAGIQGFYAALGG